MAIKLQIIRDNSVIWPKGVLQTKPLTRNAERNLKQSKDTMLLKILKTLKNIYKKTSYTCEKPDLSGNLFTMSNQKSKTWTSIFNSNWKFPERSSHTENNKIKISVCQVFINQRIYVHKMSGWMHYHTWFKISPVYRNALRIGIDILKYPSEIYRSKYQKILPKIAEISKLSKIYKEEEKK